MGLLRRRKHFAHRAHYPLRLTQECVDAALHIAAMFKSLSRENLQQALDELIPLNIRQIHLLPFHQYGEPKYRLLGKTWSMKEVPAPSSADVATMREMAERAGFQVTVGG